MIISLESDHRAFWEVENISSFCLFDSLGSNLFSTISPGNTHLDALAGGIGDCPPTLNNDFHFMIVIRVLQLSAFLESVQTTADRLIRVVFVRRPYVSEEVVVMSDQGWGVLCGGGRVVRHGDRCFC